MATTPGGAEHLAANALNEKETLMLDQKPGRYRDARDVASDDDQRLQSATRTANLLVGMSVALLLVGLAVLIVVR